MNSQNASKYSSMTGVNSDKVDDMEFQDGINGLAQSKYRTLHLGIPVFNFYQQMIEMDGDTEA